MTYASIILPYELKKNDVNSNPKTTQSLKGKLKSAMQKGGAALKNAVQNPGATFKTLGTYLQSNEDAILNKFSGIALAQMLANGKVTNQAALDYLFLGFAPALDQQALAMGYSGVTQMKDAILNGSINVGSFVSGFSKTLKSVTDYKNGIKNKMEQKKNNIIEIDITLNHSEQYQSESPDRRVQDGISWQEVLHNLPEIFSLECGLQDGRRYGVEEFKGYLKQLRDSKQPFGMVFSDGGNEIDTYKNVVLQNFTPSVMGARSGLDYTLELKNVHIGSVEVTPIVIKKLDYKIYQDYESTGKGIGAGSTNVNIPNYVKNPASNSTKLTSNTNQSMYARAYDLGQGNVAKGVAIMMGIGNEDL